MTFHASYLDVCRFFFLFSVSLDDLDPPHSYNLNNVSLFFSQLSLELTPAEIR